MKSFFILFGLPGSGKSYIAEIIKSRYGYPVYDGDLEIPLEMKQALFAKQPITDAMRQQFQEALMAKVQQLMDTGERFVFMQTFLKDDLRKEIHAKYSELQFMHVESDTALREKRYSERNEFNLGIDYLRKMSSFFEAPTIPHIVIKNNQNGTEDLIQQLVAVFK